MQTSLKAHKPAKPVLGIVLLVGSVYVGLSLLSYSQSDPSWNFSTSETSRISNLGGLFGSYLSDALYQSIGIVSFLLVLGCFIFGLQNLRPKTIHFFENIQSDKKPKWIMAAAVGLFCICVSGLLALIPLKIYSGISLGGAIGHFITRLGIFCFSTLGASLIFSGGLWVSIVLLVNQPFIIPLSWLSALKPKFKFKAPSAEPIAKKLEEFFKRREQPKVLEQAPVSPLVKKEEPAESKGFIPKALDLFARTPDPEEEGEDGRVLLVQEAPSRKSISKKSKSSAPFELPSLQLIDLPEIKGFEISKDELIANSRALEQKLLDFGIQGHVTNIRPGPIITLYEFEPAPGVKVKNIINLTDDLKLAMKAVSIRIIAPIPGRAAVGIEIPNPRRQTVYLREILQSSLFQNSASPLTLGMGKTTSGDPYVTDLSKMPHLLIAGATGSGKSVGLNGMVVSLLYKAPPEELKFIMIDPKMLELSVYEGIPHLLLPVVTDPKKAARALAWAVKEMERRYKLISSLGARNLKSYNEKVAKLSEDELRAELEKTAQSEASTSAIIEDEEEDHRKQALHDAGLDHYVQLPYICIVIDELADLIMVAARDVEESIARLAQMARAAGIHLIIATQRPSVDVITGVIKANLPTRCAFQVASKVDSRTIIDTNGAENLIGDGDMLFLPPGTSRLERLHGPFISEDEIARVVRHLRNQGDPEYSSQINLEDSVTADGEILSEGEEDELYDQALQVVFETKSPSASMLQRRLRVGYNRAARMIERMEREGVVSAPLGGGKGREILMTPSHDS